MIYIYRITYFLIYFHFLCKQNEKLGIPTLKPRKKSSITWPRNRNRRQKTKTKISRPKPTPNPKTEPKNPKKKINKKGTATEKRQKLGVSGGESP